MRKKIRNQASEHDEETIRAYLALPAAKKLEFVEALNRFLQKWMPPSSKRVWFELRKRGW